MTLSKTGPTASTSTAGWSDAVDSHQKVWTAIDTIAWRARLSPSGLAKAAGMDSTAFNRSKRQDAHGRQRWPNVETIQKILDATGTTWPEFARLVEDGTPVASQSD
ncbi:helix-turn-helix transcriptional regulator [Microvirga zambiensis]|uniref:helix-turn-helix transcriptional regulator n=1 Tax=Microvirga zambiensis TaxID=1402137 RepID=UPI00191F84B1|nr:helix-turn-helix transcriptional regulator [Microvirga zambiensis]